MCRTLTDKTGSHLTALFDSQPQYKCTMAIDTKSGDDARRKALIAKRAKEIKFVTCDVRKPGVRRDRVGKVCDLRMTLIRSAPSDLDVPSVGSLQLRLLVDRRVEYKQRIARYV